MSVPTVFSAAKRRRLWIFALGFVALIAAGATYWYWSIPRLNVILVTFDTTRADHLGVYGYQHGLTEGFDNFARRGVIFDRAYAPAPVTLPSHATMLTGLYPPEHGLRVNGVGRLDDGIPLLTEILKEHGYDTGAFIAAAVLDSNYGLERGFDTYDDELPTAKSAGHHGEARRDGQDVVDSAVSWLQQRTSRPFFCWIHLYDAHAPYDSRPDAFGQKFENNPYDAGVAWEVQQFERLTTFLQDRKLDENTLVIVAGDHGEGLGDHEEFEHGMLVYDTTLHVPFIFVGSPDCQPGTHVSEVVSLVDLTPTVLDILRIPQPKHVSGRSLLAALQGKSIDSRDCYAETETPFLYSHWSPIYTVISDRWKYIQTTRPELYDLENDPGELTNLAESAGEECQEMRNTLEILKETFVPMAAQNLILTDKDKANLEALGYVSGGNAGNNPRESKDAEILPDVKDMLSFVEKFERARDLGSSGKFEESLALLKEIVHATNEFHAAEALLGDCFGRTGQMDQAVATYRSLLVKRPEFSAVRFKLGKILSGQGQFEQAVAEFRELNKQPPDTATGHFELAEALAKLRKFEEAISEYRRAIQLSPEFVLANMNLGQLLTAIQRPKEAADCFEQAIKYAPGAADAHAYLMIALSQTGSSAKAIEHGKQAVALQPDSFEKRFNLGILFVTQRRYTEGIAELREAQRLSPNDPRPLQQIQQAEAALKQR